MKELKYQLYKKTFIAKINQTRKTKKYKILIFSFLFIISICSFLTMLFINPYNPKETIINSPQVVLNENLLFLLVGLVSGFGLSVAGASMQGITRNPLSGPTTLGFIPIASLGILVIDITRIKGQTYLYYIIPIVFSLLALLINFISLRSNSKSYKVVLIGLIFGAFITGISSILASIYKLNFEIVNIWIGQSNFSYTSGNFKWEKFIYSSILIFLAFGVILAYSKKINIIENNVTLAKSLGINIKKIYWIIGLCSVVITVSVINLIGTIVLIGIIIPHLTRYLLNTKNYYIITPMSGFLCGNIISMSMYINKIYGYGINLYTVVLSVPLFIYLIFFRKNHE